MLASEFQEKIMEIQYDGTLVDVHRAQKIKEVCDEHAKDLEELAAMSFDECEGGACKL